MIREAIATLVAGGDLDEATMEAAMAEVMAGEATPSQIAGLLVALRMKGETAPQLAGAARAMRAVATPICVRSRPLVDTCGTGGDGRGTFNISTTAAFVVAGAGQPVAKHGNRFASSRSGSADVLQALGVSLDLAPEDVARAIDTVGIGFLYAPRFHPSMRHAGPTRQELGVRTVMNLLGPLTNPAAAERQLVGVPDPALLDLVAGALARLGSERAWVVCGAGGFDELTPTGPAEGREVMGGEVRPIVIDPERLGLDRVSPDDLAGGDPAANARLTRRVLEGAPGPARQTVLLNAAAALVVAGRAEDLAEGLAAAARSIDSGAALAKLEGLRGVKAGG
jgi:anthranilate phosphoribosyltransferase